ncbi:unnamed protein product [Peronospora belbahrii]|uniref:Uncharacterized protein n=1 Tax=Peronospora belbahrii TaxID=622444 RepID=A0AAU9L022_9STRA|nr:unnamed protein product [Peronospora belbahrii]
MLLQFCQLAHDGSLICHDHGQLRGSLVAAVRGERRLNLPLPAHDPPLSLQLIGKRASDLGGSLLHLLEFSRSTSFLHCVAHVPEASSLPTATTISF